MKYIKLFLASSIEEFQHERQELATYITSLNNIYVRRGLFFELNICENLSNAVAKERKQAEYNDCIRECQYFYVMFGERARQYSIEEFDVALQAFRETGSPKVYVYFLQLPEGRTAEDSVTQFMARIDQELRHYYSSFTHIDTIKLNLIMEFCRDAVVGGQVSLEDGQVKVDGQAVLSMENIPLYSKNEAVQQLLTRERELDENFAALAALPDSEAVKRMRLENSAERNKIAEQLHTLEMDVLGLYQTVSEKRQLGTALNWREKKAIELVDAGNYEGAKQLLRDETWKQEVRQAEEIIDSATERIRQYISGQRTLIQTIRSTGITQESEQEIIEIYEDITALAQKHQIELDAIFDYAWFLNDQNRFQEGIQVAEKLKQSYDLHSGSSAAEQAKFLTLLGALYANQRRFEDAQDCYQRALGIYRDLSAADPEVYELDVATICNGLAALFENIHDYKEAETLGCEALAIHRRLAARNPEAHEPYEAATCNTLAVLFYDLKRYDEAEKLWREALQIRRRLAVQNPEVYEQDVVATGNNLAALLNDTGRRRETEELYYEMLESCERLAKQNPSAYEPDVAMICNNLAVSLDESGRKEEAEKLYCKSLEIRRRLASQNPEAYEPYLSQTCNNLAVLIAGTNRHKEAEKLYCEALEIDCRLAEQNPGVYEQNEAMTCNNFAIFLSDTGRHEEAKTLYHKALEIYRRKAVQYPEGYEPDVARVCNNLANLLSDLWYKKKTEKLYREAAEIYRRLAAKAPKSYDLYLAGTCYNFAVFQFNIKRDIAAAKALFEEALAIYEKYPQQKAKAKEVQDILSEYF